MEHIDLQYFTYSEGNLLVRILLAFILSGVLTSRRLFGRLLNSNFILSILGIVMFFLISWWLTRSLGLTVCLTIPGLLSFGASTVILHYKLKRAFVFVRFERVFRLLMVVIVWLVYSDLFQRLIDVLLGLANHNLVSLVVLAYLTLLWPSSQLIAIVLDRVSKYEFKGFKVDRRGEIIGMLERTIILTCILLGAYEAIGFLIAGKSIIRFSPNSESSKSEYVLLGTLLSFGIAVFVGAIIVLYRI